MLIHTLTHQTAAGSLADSQVSGQCSPSYPGVTGQEYPLLALNSLKKAAENSGLVTNWYKINLK